LIIVETEHS